MQLGHDAPEFQLKDQYGKEHTLKQYRGQWVLIYFYPKDDTPGCTKEACGMRDNFADFEDGGVVILGISRDSVESHKKFAEKYNLPFTILADDQTKAAKAYDVWGEKTFMGKKHMGIHRMSFLINPEGKIKKIYEKVKPEAHAKEILEDIVMLKSEK